MPLAFLCIENPQLGWGFRKASSFEPDIKTPFDLLKHLAVWQLQCQTRIKGSKLPSGGIPKTRRKHGQTRNQKGVPMGGTKRA
ncbi:hypothetical protein A6J63_025290 [Yersinia enterocolitica]|nr:hypothetical protein A6J63_025290 [Yersinia enterocolitica]